MQSIVDLDNRIKSGTASKTDEHITMAIAGGLLTGTAVGIVLTLKAIANRFTRRR
jgi:uncharacterized membrane-anchored protein YitT (DUF2179 family)